MVSEVTGEESMDVFFIFQDEPFEPEHRDFDHLFWQFSKMGIPETISRVSN